MVRRVIGITVLALASFAAQVIGVWSESDQEAESNPKVRVGQDAYESDLLIDSLKTLFPVRTDCELVVTTSLRASSSDLEDADGLQPELAGTIESGGVTWGRPVLREQIRTGVSSEFPSYYCYAMLVSQPDFKGLALRETISRKECFLTVSRVIPEARLEIGGKLSEAAVKSLLESKVASLQYLARSDPRDPSASQNPLPFLGKFRSREILADLHSAEFATQCKVTLKGEAVLEMTHEPSGLVFKFLNGSFKSVVFEYAERKNEIVPLAVGKEGEVTSFALCSMDGHKGTLVQLESVSNSKGQADFQFFPVKDGTPVIQESDRNIYREMKGGEAVIVIDKRAKEKIDFELDVKGVAKETSINDNSGLALSSYLNSSKTNNLCGVYSMAFCAAKMGVEMPLGLLVSNSKYMSQPNGSSARDLLKLAEDYQISAQFVSNASMEMLRHHAGPSILHFRDPFNKSGHWAVCTGFDSAGLPMIVDLPDEEITMDQASLLMYWDMQCILVRKSPGNMFTLIIARVNQLWLVIGIVAGLFLMQVVFPSIASVGFKTQIGVLLVCFLGSSLLWQFLFPLSYWNNPSATIGMSQGVNDPLEEIFELQQLPQNCQLIDCRLADAFEQATIDGAISLPINARAGFFNTAIKNLSPDAPTIVFCESQGCRWADVIGERLRQSGFQDVKIFRPGFQVYREKRTSQKL
jgi:rhodanese-related sulfurtransferase